MKRRCVRTLFVVIFCLVIAWQLCLFIINESDLGSDGDGLHQRLHKIVIKPDEERVTEETNKNEEEVKDDHFDKVVPDKIRKIRPKAFPRNSFISPFHKHWDVNCSEILGGDNQIVRETTTMLDQLRDKDGSLPIPTDEEIEKWMDDCREFTGKRHYLETPLSDEEEEYPVAFIITTHKEVVQVERLLRSIYQPQNIYCIHPDAKSPAAYQRAIRKLASCFDNVFIASKVEKVEYYGFTRLLADINCMADLVQHHVKWKYVINLCGQDFPLKTNLEIVHQLKAHNGHNDINGIIPPPYIVPRIKYPPPYNLTAYFGNAYYAATHEFVDFVIHDKIAIDSLKWARDVWSPDEHYWVTLQRALYTPGGYPNGTWDSNVRFIKWGDNRKIPKCRGKGKYVRAICVFGVGYLEYLHRQPFLFANKFYYSYDPIAIQCLEEMLDYRTWHPELSDQLDDSPRKDYVWQSYVPPKKNDLQL
ncbi:N-acetyllactosaminide beta-1,6-N-acetylglucosaminyl-transferase-like [Amphiura filiformis]|uniref:N-acetyllactosaminide beta-1,6-N-acetylglucosaminyl-transferase-like n=1 Tax=Amphiura filiformis TaxID=82378 RepID=UPI003B20BBBF